MECSFFDFAIASAELRDRWNGIEMIFFATPEIVLPSTIHVARATFYGNISAGVILRAPVSPDDKHIIGFDFFRWAKVDVYEPFDTKLFCFQISRR